MKLSAIAASVLALGLLTGTGYAASMSDTSTIKKIDIKAHQLTLADGKVFGLPTSWKLKMFKTGQKVKVTYKMKGTAMTAMSLHHAA